MPEPFQVAVVGAGPAGLAAAVHAAGGGLTVVLVDAAPRPGGQYWRHPDPAHAPQDHRADERAGQHDWNTFAALRAALQEHVDAGRIRYLARSQVALLDRSPDYGRPDLGGPLFLLHLTPVTGDAPPVQDVVVATDLILCPGGYDRQLPVPGWDLPGVMAAGGVQALLKGSRTLPGKRAVIAGTGPFLLPVATAFAAAGGEVAAVCEANSPARWIPQAHRAAQAPAKGREALGYVAAFARHQIPYHPRTVVTQVLGEREVRGAVVARTDAAGRVRPGTSREIEADLVAFGWGFTPSLELPLAVGARTRLDVDGSLVVAVDDHQRTSTPHVRVAGEATGVGGAALALAEGELAARSLAAELTGRPLSGRALRRRIGRLRAFAHAMHAAHPIPPGWTRWLADDTLVCRCEEVPVAAVRDAVENLGAADPRTVRSLTRVGMGWCQGQICATGCARLVADLTDRPVTAGALEAVSRRTFAAPLELSRVARLDAPTALKEIP
jgi:NADPH-dependent 2,4-dienoyl-CoA reductase/sulfur reductase-like enzyme